MTKTPSDKSIVQGRHPDEKLSSPFQPHVNEINHTMIDSVPATILDTCPSLSQDDKFNEHNNTQNMSSTPFDHFTVMNEYAVKHVTATTFVAASPTHQNDKIVVTIPSTDQLPVSSELGSRHQQEKSYPVEMSLHKSSIHSLKEFRRTSKEPGEVSNARKVPDAVATTASFPFSVTDGIQADVTMQHNLHNQHD